MRNAAARLLVFIVSASWAIVGFAQAVDNGVQAFSSESGNTNVERNVLLKRNDNHGAQSVLEEKEAAREAKKNDERNREESADNLTRELLRSLYKDTEAYCGCTHEFIKDIASTQSDIIASLSPFFYVSDGLDESKEIMLEAIKESAMQGALCLKKHFDCGCEPSYYTSGLGEYKDCCCKAETVKDIYLDRMEQIGGISDDYLALGPEFVQQIINGIVAASDATLALIKEHSHPPSLPTRRPSQAPTVMPTGPLCNMRMDIDCTDHDGTDCSMLPPLRIMCEDRPTAMKFRYTGDSCTESVNMQDGKFTCKDFNSGPPKDEGEESYIVATAAKAKGNDLPVYFSGTVAVGNDFPLFDGGKDFASDMNVTVYSSPGGDLLQTLEYHSSCSRDLFLKDTFGSVQLTSFVNRKQGTVTCFKPVMYSYGIFNGEDSNIIMKTLNRTLNSVFLDLTWLVQNQIFPPGKSELFVETVRIDMTEHRQYTVEAIATGQARGVDECASKDVLEFEAGNPEIPPGVPTMSPKSKGKGANKKGSKSSKSKKRGKESKRRG